MFCFVLLDCEFRFVWYEWCECVCWVVVLVVVDEDGFDECEVGVGFDY